MLRTNLAEVLDFPQQRAPILVATDAKTLFRLKHDQSVQLAEFNKLLFMYFAQNLRI